MLVMLLTGSNYDNQISTFSTVGIGLGIKVCENNCQCTNCMSSYPLEEHHSENLLSVYRASDEDSTYMEVTSSEEESLVEVVDVNPMGQAQTRTMTIQHLPIPWWIFSSLGGHARC